MLKLIVWQQDLLKVLLGELTSPVILFWAYLGSHIVLYFILTRALDLLDPGM